MVSLWGHGSQCPQWPYHHESMIRKRNIVSIITSGITTGKRGRDLDVGMSCAKNLRCILMSRPSGRVSD